MIQEHFLNCEKYLNIVDQLKISFNYSRYFIFIRISDLFTCTTWLFH